MTEISSKQTPEELKLIREENDRLTLQQERRSEKVNKLRNLTHRLKRHADDAVSYLDSWQLDYAEPFYEKAITTSEEALKELARLYEDPDFIEYALPARPRSRSRSPASRDKESKK